jgi:hypothetical protein
MTTPNDSRDFYPTPDILASNMVYSLKREDARFFALPSPILEPSAGDGALARAIHSAAGVYHDSKTGEVLHDSMDKAKRLDLDCIELSSDFRAKLKKDGFRVVHDDFLTFRPCKKYAAIVMNPPFSAGAAHLLKALDVMKDGGMIRCLLNAETLRNPCTNERKELAARLEALHATVKYIPDAFKNAARRTDVEIAFVSVNIPEREPVSKIRLELQHEMTDRMTDDPQLAALVSSDPITAAIERYNAAAEGIRRIYEEYNGIKSLFSSPTANETPENSVLSFNKNYNEAIRSLRALYWQKLFDLPQIRDNLTAQMQSEYGKRIAELSDYDFSTYNILTIREEMSRNMIQGIEKEIIGLFDKWTNLHYNSEYSKNVHYYNGWCTNEAYKVGKKVIFWCPAFDSWSGRFEPGWDVERSLSQIERTLHYLDTNGQKYNGDALRATLKAAEKAGQSQKIQLHYFTATFYKKGTCHIEFTNDDVLKSFNLFASQKKGWLPPSYGKKSYHEMSRAEQKIVDSYEGEASYTDTLTRHLIPTTASLLQLGA